MLSIDEEILPTYKIKMKNALIKIRCIRMILPKELRKYQGNFYLKKYILINECLELPCDKSNILPLNKNSENKSNKDKKDNVDSKKKNDLDINFYDDNKYNTNNNLNSKKNKDTLNNYQEKKEEEDKDNLIRLAIALNVSKKSNKKKKHSINSDNNNIKVNSSQSLSHISNNFENFPNKPIPVFEDNLNSPYDNILNRLKNFESKNENNLIRRNIKIDNKQRLENLKAKSKSKLDTKNLIVKDFVFEEDNSDRSMLNNVSQLVINENNNNEENKENKIIAYEIETFEIFYPSKANTKSKNIKKNKNNNQNDNISNNEKDNFNNKQNKPQKVLKFFYKTRNFTLPVKSIQVDCFVINITENKDIKVRQKNIQSIMKTFIIFLIFFALWILMAVFINNLVEKYGSSTFSVCIMPIFTIFLVNLFFTANIQFFIMAYILKTRGWKYLNTVKKDLIEQVIFMALVHPHALDHYMSIMFYQEYLKYHRYKIVYT